jgi:small-conductance mechanosensitive channel
VLLLVPVVLLMLAAKTLFLWQLWGTRHERPGLRDLRRRDRFVFLGALASGIGLGVLVALGYGDLGAKVLLVVVGSVAVVLVAMVPIRVWVYQRGSPELQQRLLGCPPKR